FIVPARVPEYAPEISITVPHAVGITRSLQKLENAIAETASTGSFSQVARIRQAHAPRKPVHARILRVVRTFPVNFVSGAAIKPEHSDPKPPMNNGSTLSIVLFVTSTWKRSSMNVGAQVIRKYQGKLRAKYCRQSSHTVRDFTNFRHGVNWPT